MYFGEDINITGYKREEEEEEEEEKEEKEEKNSFPVPKGIKPYL